MEDEADRVIEWADAAIRQAEYRRAELQPTPGHGALGLLKLCDSGEWREPGIILAENAANRLSSAEWPSEGNTIITCQPNARKDPHGPPGGVALAAPREVHGVCPQSGLTGNLWSFPATAYDTWQQQQQQQQQAGSRSGGGCSSSGGAPVASRGAAAAGGSTLQASVAQLARHSSNQTPGFAFSAWHTAWAGPGGPGTGQARVPTGYPGYGNQVASQGASTSSGGQGYRSQGAAQGTSTSAAAVGPAPGALLSSAPASGGRVLSSSSTSAVAPPAFPAASAAQGRCIASGGSSPDELSLLESSMDASYVQQYIQQGDEGCGNSTGSGVAVPAPAARGHVSGAGGWRNRSTGDAAAAAHHSSSSGGSSAQPGSSKSSRGTDDTSAAGASSSRTTVPPGSHSSRSLQPSTAPSAANGRPAATAAKVYRQLKQRIMAEALRQQAIEDHEDVDSWADLLPSAPTTKVAPRPPRNPPPG